MTPQERRAGCYPARLHPRPNHNLEDPVTQQTEPTADQALRERIATTLSAAGAFCGNCGFQPGDRGCPDCERCWASYAAALLPLFAEERTAVVRDELRGLADLWVDQAAAEVEPRRRSHLRARAAELRARADAIHPAATAGGA